MNVLDVAHGLGGASIRVPLPDSLYACVFKDRALCALTIVKIVGAVHPWTADYLPRISSVRVLA